MGISYLLRDVHKAINATRAIYRDSKIIRRILAILFIWNIALTLWLLTISSVMIYQKIQQDKFPPNMEVPLEALEYI